jgi:uncharacterized protein YbjT (DUF2867 family)
MKLIIFGSTGSVGQHVVEQALEQGHHVTAFSRNPAALAYSHANLSTITGDVFDPQSVAAAIQGHDAVLVSLGSLKWKNKVRSVGTRNIVQGMQQHGVKRLICQTTLGVGDSEGNLNFYWKYIMFGLLLRPFYKDHIIQEGIVKNSGLDWTIVRPGSFTDEPPMGTYKQGFSGNEKSLTLKIPRADVADFMVKQINDNTYLHKTPGVSY